MALSRELVERGGMWTGQVKSHVGDLSLLTASTTQTQAGGTPVTSSATIVSTANASDAITLPPAGKGSSITIRNTSGNTIQIFPPVGGKINNGTANAAVTLTTANSVELFYHTDIDTMF